MVAPGTKHWTPVVVRIWRRSSMWGRRHWRRLGWRPFWCCCFMIQSMDLWRMPARNFAIIYLNIEKGVLVGNMFSNSIFRLLIPNQPKPGWHPGFSRQLPWLLWKGLGFMRPCSTACVVGIWRGFAIGWSSSLRSLRGIIWRTEGWCKSSCLEDIRCWWVRRDWDFSDKIPGQTMSTNRKRWPITNTGWRYVAVFK